MTNLKEYCPGCGEEMELSTIDNKMTFRGVKINYKDHAFVCPGCKMEVSTTEQTGETQRAISDAYRKKVGLLTGTDICENRKKMGLTQKNLADKMSVGIASIKRWEKGIIQTKSMDKALRVALGNNDIKKTVKEMTLDELRNARDITPQQGNKSIPFDGKIELKNISISELKTFINIMGGELDITAHFPDESVKISTLSGILT